MSESLKEFEKWWKKDHRKIPEESCMSHIGYPEAKTAWIAAMEQVLLWGSDDDILFNKIKDEIYGE